jgi:hypothetical protein
LKYNKCIVVERKVAVGENKIITTKRKVIIVERKVTTIERMVVIKQHINTYIHHFHMFHHNNSTSSSTTSCAYQHSIVNKHIYIAKIYVKPNHTTTKPILYVVFYD